METGSATTSDLKGNWLQENKRADFRMIEMARKKKWPVPDDIEQKMVDRAIEIMDDKKDNRAALKAIDFLKTVIDDNDGVTKEGTTNHFNVTVNQNASDGGIIENKAAVAAAADWVAAMANDAGDAGGDRMVRDAGPVQSSPTLGPLEQEAG